MSEGVERARRRWRAVVAYLLAGAFVLGAVMHVRALVTSGVDPESPPWRHAVFIALNLACVAGFVARPWYFLPGFVLLAIQQASTHGVSVVRAAARGELAGEDVAVMATFVVGIGLLTLDAMDRRKSARRSSV